MPFGIVAYALMLFSWTTFVETAVLWILQRRKSLTGSLILSNVDAVLGLSSIREIFVFSYKADRFHLTVISRLLSVGFPRLVGKFRANFSTNGKPNKTNRVSVARAGRTRFLALGAGLLTCLRTLIGSFCCLRLL